ncbi:MAG: DUF2116 family Zn-ribbon domain-containing protein [Candidatus Lokiarchaeota archaeon]|nr:DUF2116 family Zn-ribbon domain-containing protein [Candidatus Lokiarchaeota archaeon]
MSNSSWKDQIQKKWGPHKHCPICGRAMAREKSLCSQSCNDNYTAQEKKKKKKGRRNTIMMVGCLVAMILIMFVIPFATPS